MTSILQFHIREYSPELMLFYTNDYCKEYNNLLLVFCSLSGPSEVIQLPYKHNSKEILVFFLQN